MNQAKRCVRRGGILVAILVCLTIVSSLAIGALTTAIRNHRETKLLHQLRQTDLLVDSGIKRALSEFELDSNYDGEQWRPSMESFDGEIIVKIEVKQSICLIAATMRPEHGQITRRSDRVQLSTKLENER